LGAKGLELISNPYSRHPRYTVAAPVGASEKSILIFGAFYLPQIRRLKNHNS